MNNKVEILVRRGEVVERPFEVSGDTRERLWTFEPMSRATVLVRSSGDGQTVTDIVVGEGADVEVIEIVEHGADFTSTYTIEQQRDSRYKSTVIDLSGGHTRRQQTVTLAGSGAECELRGLYVAMGDANVENGIKVVHAVPQCTSRQLFKGIVGGRATAFFSGLINVALDAQQTAAFQENHSILLTDTAHSYTRPQLEIYADDVKCSHGATVGRLDPEAIFYMMQRGIGAAEAMKLQLAGFANDVVDRIGLDDLKEQMESKIAGILSR